MREIKAYIIRIELTDSSPLIWRKVIIPADVTFYRLHQIIQSVTNFMSRYGPPDYHLYEFDLENTDQRVTNDEEAYAEYQYFKKNPNLLSDRLKTMPEDLMAFELGFQERVKKEVRKPKHMKIDDYLETYNVISYDYDFGAGWNFIITLEDTVEDYNFGYPTLLEGAETAPPEDVGGIEGFDEFKTMFYDENHPDHETAVNWVKNLVYWEYDVDHVNSVLKRCRYKKTQWENINHENHKIIHDPYRKL